MTDEQRPGDAGDDLNAPGAAPSGSLSAGLETPDPDHVRAPERMVKERRIHAPKRTRPETRFRPLPLGFSIVAVATFLAATAVAATAWWPVYRDDAFVLMAVITVVVGAGIGVVGALLRANSLALGAVTLAAFVVLGVPLAVPRESVGGVLPTLPGLLDLVTGTALGWRQLLTITLPVGDYQALLVPPYLLLLVGTVVGISVALRAKWGELALVAPVVVFVTAIAFGPEEVTGTVPVALAFVVVLLITLVWRRRYRRREALRLLAPSGARPGIRRNARVRAWIAATVLVAVAAAASVAAVTLVPPAGAREVLRTVVVQPFDPREYVSPLSAFRRYWQEPVLDAVLFTVNGAPDGARIRLATLDSYDGIVAAVGSEQVDTASGAFVRVPYRIDQDVTGTPVSVDVVVGEYANVWLPTIGDLEQVSFEGADADALGDRFYYNDVNGTGAVVGGLESGDAYSLEAVLPATPTDEQLVGLDPGRARVPSVGTEPDELLTRLDEWTGSATTPGAKLLAMLEGFRTDGYISHGVADDEAPSRSGHSAARITELFTDPLMVGDAEQYAVAASLMARELGFPSRVVTGFVSDDAAVTGADASAWIEVYTAQLGWVTVDPVPPVRDLPEETEDDLTQVNRPQTEVLPPEEDELPRDEQAPPESEQDDQPQADPLLALLLRIATVTGWSLLGLGILASPFLAIVAAKWRRRAKRNRATAPLDRIRGGWEEFRDGAVDRGYRPPNAATRRQVAETVGGTQSRLLAVVADRAVFAPDEPSPTDADRVWKAVGELSRAMDARLSRWQRIKSLISLRSLRGYGGAERGPR